MWFDCENTPPRLRSTEETLIQIYSHYTHFRHSLTYFPKRVN